MELTKGLPEAGSENQGPIITNFELLKKDEPNEPEPIKARVVKWFDDKRYGFVVDEKGTRYFLHESQLEGTPKVDGLVYVPRVEKTEKGYRANGAMTEEVFEARRFWEYLDLPPSEAVVVTGEPVTNGNEMVFTYDSPSGDARVVVTLPKPRSKIATYSSAKWIPNPERFRQLYHEQPDGSLRLTEPQQLAVDGGRLDSIQDSWEQKQASKAWTEDGDRGVWLRAQVAEKLPDIGGVAKDDVNLGPRNDLNVKASFNPEEVKRSATRGFAASVLVGITVQDAMWRMRITTEQARMEVDGLVGRPSQRYWDLDPKQVEDFFDRLDPEKNTIDLDYAVLGRTARSQAQIVDVSFELADQNVEGDGPVVVMNMTADAESVGGEQKVRISLYGDTHVYVNGKRVRVDAEASIPDQWQEAFKKVKAEAVALLDDKLFERLVQLAETVGLKESNYEVDVERRVVEMRPNGWQLSQSDEVWLDQAATVIDVELPVVDRLSGQAKRVTLPILEKPEELLEGEGEDFSKIMESLKEIEELVLLFERMSQTARDRVTEKFPDLKVISSRESFDTWKSNLIADFIKNIITQLPDPSSVSRFTLWENSPKGEELAQVAEEIKIGRLLKTSNQGSDETAHLDLSRFDGLIVINGLPCKFPNIDMRNQVVRVHGVPTPNPLPGTWTSHERAEVSMPVLTMDGQVMVVDGQELWVRAEFWFNYGSSGYLYHTESFFGDDSDYSIFYNLEISRPEGVSVGLALGTPPESQEVKLNYEQKMAPLLNMDIFRQNMGFSMGELLDQDDQMKIDEVLRLAKELDLEKCRWLVTWMEKLFESVDPNNPQDWNFSRTRLGETYRGQPDSIDWHWQILEQPQLFPQYNPFHLLKEAAFLFERVRFKLRLDRKIRNEPDLERLMGVSDDPNNSEAKPEPQQVVGLASRNRSPDEGSRDRRSSPFEDNPETKEVLASAGVGNLAEEGLLTLAQVAEPGQDRYSLPNGGWEIEGVTNHDWEGLGSQINTLLTSIEGISLGELSSRVTSFGDGRVATQSELLYKLSIVVDLLGIKPGDSQQSESVINQMLDAGEKLHLSNLEPMIRGVLGMLAYERMSDDEKRNWIESSYQFPEQDELPVAEVLSTVLDKLSIAQLQQKLLEAKKRKKDWADVVQELLKRGGEGAAAMIESQVCGGKEWEKRVFKNLLGDDDFESQKLKYTKLLSTISDQAEVVEMLTQEFSEEQKRKFYAILWGKLSNIDVNSERVDLEGILIDAAAETEE